MKRIQFIGIMCFLFGLIFFSTLSFFGRFEISLAEMNRVLPTSIYEQVETDAARKIAGVVYNNACDFSVDFMRIYNQKNEQLIAEEKWEQVMWTPASEVALSLGKAANSSRFVAHPWTYFLLTFGMGIVGALMYIVPTISTLGHAGIKNNGVQFHSATNRGWMGILTFVFLFVFYIVLYFYPFILINQMALLDPIKSWFIPGEKASQWFLYGFLYTVVMLVMGIKMMIKYRHSSYHLVRTTVLLFFQFVFAFLLVEVLPMLQLPAVDLKNAWPLDYDFLFDWNVVQLFESGNFGKFVFIWGITLSLILVPLLTYFFGKRWYCSWVCGCGGLAETLGDPYRHLSSKSLISWKFERWMIHLVLVFAVLMTVFTGYHTYNELNNPAMANKEILLGISAYSIRNVYSFLIGAVFAGVIGTGFYPIFGNRVWCRFGCPLAAYMGIIQRFKSRFRITTNGGQCISCGNCSTYCEQGIDVRWYAQRQQDITRASCVGCGVCASVCPRGVLKLENGPVSTRVMDKPLVIKENGEIELIH